MQRLPLDKIVVMVTRPREQASELQTLLESRGATVLLQPAIEIAPPEDQNALALAARDVVKGKYQWILFSSANGVAFVMPKIINELESRGEIENIGEHFARANVKFATVGAKTAQVLRKFGVERALEPEKFDADALADALINADSEITRKRAISFRADRGKKTLGETLRARGVEFHEVVAYRSVDVLEPSCDVKDAIRLGRVDLATVMSSASCLALCKMLGDDAKKIGWLALSEVIAQILREQHYRVLGVSQEATSESLVELAVDLALKGVIKPRTE